MHREERKKETKSSKILLGSDLFQRPRFFFQHSFPVIGCRGLFLVQCSPLNIIATVIPDLKKLAVEDVTGIIDVI